MPATSDAWGGATLTVTVDGTDVSCDVITLKVDRSKNRVWDPADAGSCQITLDITAGGQPANRGPVGTAATVHIAYGTAARYLFTGKVQKRESKVDPHAGDQLTLSCIDEFEQLARTVRRAAAGDIVQGVGETVPDRIGRWLDVAGSTSSRALDTSAYTCPGVFIDGNVLRQLQATVQADGGDLFIAGDGTVTFKAWAWQITADLPEAIFSDRELHDWVPYSSAYLADDLDEVQNKVTGTRRDDGGMTAPVPQTVSDSTSITLYRERGDPLDNLELADDTQVATRIDNLVSVAAMPNARFDSIVVQPAFDPPQSWPRTIPISFSSLIVANRVWDDASQSALYGHVIGEVWQFTPNDVTVEFRCSGTGTWDALRPPRVPINIELCPDGSVRVPTGYPNDLTSEVVLRRCGDGSIIATYTPGSLAECGNVFPTDDTCQICYFDGTTYVCYDWTSPRKDAVLWLDARDDIPDRMIERIDGDNPVAGGGFGGTRLDVIPPSASNDAIDATSTGGLIAADHSSHVAAATFTGGWTVDFWVYLYIDVPPGDFLDIVDLDSIKIRLSGISVGFDTATTVELITISTGEIGHFSGGLATITPSDWHHLIFIWDSVGGGTLTVYLDGTPL